MTQEFSNTDAELARHIKSRILHELNGFPAKRRNDLILGEVRRYMIDLCTEIINEDITTATGA